MNLGPRVLCLLAAISMLVAGCAGGGGSSVAPSSSSVAPAPTASVTEETGSISGLATDEEGRPLAKARVAIIKPISADTETDANGNFTFNDLAPGEYSLVLDKLGFESATRRAEVRAGEITEVRVSLSSLVIASEPYHLAFQKTSFFTLDSDLIAYLQYGWGVNVSQINSVRCDPCMFVLFIEPAPVDVLTQSSWAASSTPYVNNQICLNYQSKWSDDMGGARTNIIGTCMNNKASLAWTDAQVKQLKELDKVRLLVNGGLVSVQWRADVWSTFGYVEDLPEDYSALPPA